ncbi:LLM class flavin-dependent oxidoreductase [Devriesea agamarum]|uniref:LLM class flavin-dependent oxidoreductase n=1 Tax=Devriesea agamarum TaxID=472569 RepID=UPI00071C488F|nr:LLM class flavin-dependent oxidoreductase [Devriesea agamarum]
MELPLSVLDLSTVTRGCSSEDAVHGTIEVARAADELGYKRLWTAEHHNMPMVAATSPAVMIAHLAAHTRRIRLGSGGVMLPNHAPFVVAEQFSLLEALAPHRIDLGLGRAPGTDPTTARSLRGTDVYGPLEAFPDHVREILAFLRRDQEQTATGEPGLRATPAPRSVAQVWILGSSLYGAHLAAELGLPYVFAHHFRAGTDVTDAVHAYRSHFRASPYLAQPYVMVTASAIAAPTREEAEVLNRTGRLQFVALRTGRLEPLRAPQDIIEADLPAQVADLYRHSAGAQLRGTADEVVQGIKQLRDQTEADEIMLTATVHDPQVQVRTLSLIAAAWS